jgi:hypothetical protein
MNRNKRPKNFDKDNLEPSLEPLTSTIVIPRAMKIDQIKGFPFIGDWIFEASHNLTEFFKKLGTI